MNFRDTDCMHTSSIEQTIARSRQLQMMKKTGGGPFFSTMVGGRDGCGKKWKEEGGGDNVRSV